MNRPRYHALVACAALVVIVAGCLSPPSRRPGPPQEPAQLPERVLQVTATAYNSVRGQTDRQPAIAAWGDRLEPGMQVIAVSRDLLAMGLTRGVEVQIDGLPGRWVVRDKMARRWRRKIDLYMGEDVERARHWGRRRVTIRWRDPAPLAQR